MKVSTEIDNNFGYEKITQLVDNIPLTTSTILHQQNMLIQSLTLYTLNNCSIWCWWKTVEVYKIAKMYIEYVVYSSLLALSV
jgi:hypothetical protein